MVRTILVPVSGTQADEAVFATALALAERAGAHLAFHHARLTTAEAALAQVEEFCDQCGIALNGRPVMGQVTASWSGAPDHDDAEALLTRARHADLTVVGRPGHIDHMPAGLIESLLLESGRPVVLPPIDVAPPPSIDTILVGWKECAEAARALAAALPLLRRAKRVIVAHVKERGDQGKSLSDLVYHLARHGIGAERKEIDVPHTDVATLLCALAAAHEADLLVLGGYSHHPQAERIFGGVTRSVIDGTPVPVFLLH